APEPEGFRGISYVATLQKNNLDIISLEELEGKKDLYIRRISLKSGKTEFLKPLGLNAANNPALLYLKDFTLWLNPKTILTTTSSPSKKTSSLILNKTSFK